jgi:major outer membrane protein
LQVFLLLIDPFSSKHIFNHCYLEEEKMREKKPSLPCVAILLMAVNAVFGQSGNTDSCEPPKPVIAPAAQPATPICAPVCEPSCEPPKPLPPKPPCAPLQAPQPPTNSAFNAPAEINVGCQGDIDYYGLASFIYWQPFVDDLAFAYVDNNSILNTVIPGIQGNYKEMDFLFRPGFQVGVGMNLQTDDWDVNAMYTRVHGKHSASTDGNIAPDGTMATVYATTGNGFLLDLQNIGGVYSSASAEYRNHLDFVDAEVGRKYYVGKSLIFRSSFGVRGAAILQSLHVQYIYPPSLPPLRDQTGEFGALCSNLNVIQRNHSWGVGPRIGLEMDWMAGYGVRIISSGYADILYTRYHLQDKTSLTPTAANANLTVLPVGATSNLTAKERVSAIRAHFDLELGFGWGAYLKDNKWHIDLSASYGWQAFLDQNMFRKFTERSTPMLYINPTGSLFVQGLTATARVDF